MGTPESDGHPGPQTPWAMLYWPLRATDYAPPRDYLPQFPLCDLRDLCAMLSPYRRSRTEAPYHFAPSL